MAPFGIKKIFNGPLTQMDDSDIEGVGTLRFEGNKVYKYVKFVNGSGNVAVVVNNCVFYNSTAQDTVTADLTDVVGSAAGIAQGAMAQGVTAGKWGWIQIKGRSAITPNVSAGAAGNAMTHVGASDGTLDVSAAVTDPVVATLLDATGGANVINCDFPY